MTRPHPVDGKTRTRKPLAIVLELEGTPVVREWRARFERLLAELRRSLRGTRGAK